MVTNYIYSKLTDFINANTIILSDLQVAVSYSVITSASMLSADIFGDMVTLHFNNSLNVGDKAILDLIVKNYKTRPAETIVTTLTSDILSNKSIRTDLNFFTDPVDITKKIGFFTNASTTNTQLTLASQTSTNRIITYPDTTDTIATLAYTQTLTNKTITNIKLNGTGNITAQNATVYVAPSSTIMSGSNNYYFTYLKQPITTGLSSGSAYTLYIENSPSGAVINSYAVYIASGITYIGGALQIPTGAVSGYVLSSDAYGNATWVTSTFFDGTTAAPGMAFTSQLNTGFYRVDAGQIGVSLGGINYATFKTTGFEFTTGLTITSGACSVQAINATGLITANAGLTVVSNSTVVSGSNNYYFTNLTTPTTTGSTTGSAYTLYVAGAPTGVITTPYSAYIASGKTYLGGALQIPTGATTGYMLQSDAVGNATWAMPPSTTFSDGTTALPSITFTSQTNTGFYRPTTGQIGVGLSGTNYVTFKTTGTDFTTGSIINVGTSGTTSTLNVYGSINANGKLLITPSSTVVSGSNNYYFTNMSIPTTTGSTTGSAYTLYVAGAPTGAITTSYSAYVAGGKTYLGGALQIPTGAIAGYMLQSDASGNATWAPAAGATFMDGTATAPSITFTAQQNTGFYRPTTGQIGISLSGISSVLFKTTGVDFINGSVVNVGTSNTTSILNVYGTLNTYGVTSNTGNITYSGAGSSVAANTGVYIAPISTALANSTNNYYFTNMTAPTTTGSTTGSAYTFYVAGAPSGNITTPYAAYIASGKTYIGGILQYTNGAATSYILQCDSAGNATWVAPTSTNSVTAIIGSAGITVTGGAASFQAINGAGLITGAAGLTISAGASNLQVINAAGLVSCAAGLTVSTGTSALQAITAAGLISANLGLNVVTGATNVQALNAAGISTLQATTCVGLITGQAGITISTGAASLQAVTAAGLITGNAGLTISDGASNLQVINAAGLISGSAGLTISTGTSALQAITAAGLITAATGINVTTGATNVQALNAAGISTLQATTCVGLITGQAGITISTGAASLQAATIAGLLTANAGLTVSAGASNLQVINAAGLVSCAAGLTVSTGTSALQAITAAGLITANLGLNVATGATNLQALNVAGISTLQATTCVGLITGQAGITMSAGAATLQAVTAAGLITGNAGLTIGTGITSVQTITAGGLISGSLGLTISTGNSALQGVTTAALITANAGLSVVTGTTNLQITNTAGLLTANGGLTVNNGSQLQIPLGAAAGYILHSDSSGNASWATQSTDNSYVSSTGTQNTTSSTPVVITSMTLTPVAGTYYVVYSGVTKISVNNRTSTYQMAKNGTIIASTITNINSMLANEESVITFSSIIVCNGTDIITVMFNANGASTPFLTASNQKSLFALRLGA